ncbi:MAG: pyridoxal phosphate-dependent aminotransferase [Hyphomicrobiales bacterium]
MPFDPAQCLSQRTAAVEEAAILRMAQKARDLKAAGRSIVSLTVGEPDFDTPAHIRTAAAEALDQGYTHYAPVNGIPELKAAISKKLKDENGLSYTPAEIVLSNGAKQSITNTAFALLDEGDEVILLAPYWVAYEGIVRMAGGVPKVLKASADENFKVPAKRIAAALTDRTRFIIVNSPSNPTGAIWTRAELEALAEVVSGHPKLMVLSDEIYEYITFEGTALSFGSLPSMKERTVTVNGFSKGFAMTGWRLGFAAAPEPVAKAIGKIQGTFTAGANYFVQRAALVALESDRSAVEDMRRQYRARRDLVARRLSAINGLVFSPPPGSFYAFPQVARYLGRTDPETGKAIATVDQMSDWLLDRWGLATVPGSAFGDDTCIRLSFAASEAELDEGLTRLEQGLRSLV